MTRTLLAIPRSVMREKGGVGWMTLSDQLNKLCSVQYMYESLYPIERYCLRFGFLPFWVNEDLHNWDVTLQDLMKYDKIVRSKNRR